MKLVHSLGASLMSAMVLTGCLLEDEREPIMLGGANTFPTDLEQVRNSYDYSLMVVGQEDAGYDTHENGRMQRRYEEIPRETQLLDSVFAVTDEYQPAGKESHIEQYQVGFRSFTGFFVLYKGSDGSKVGPDEGSTIVEVPINVGDRYTTSFRYQGQVRDWQTHAEIKVLDTQVVSTHFVDIEAYLIQIRGDNTNDDTFSGTADYRFTTTLWVSPEYGIIKEQRSVRERDVVHGADVNTELEYLLRGYVG